MNVRYVWVNRKQAVADVAIAFCYNWHNDETELGDVDRVVEKSLSTYAKHWINHEKPNSRERIIARLLKDAEKLAIEKWFVFKEFYLGVEDDD